jgi:hypothetical protein
VCGIREEEEKNKLAGEEEEEEEEEIDLLTSVCFLDSLKLRRCKRKQKKTKQKQHKTLKTSLSLSLASSAKNFCEKKRDRVWGSWDVASTMQTCFDAGSDGTPICA